MPHFRPWPSHSCRRSPLFSEQDAPVPCPLPPSHSHAIAGPSSRLAAPEKSQTGPAPRTSLLPACWDTGRVSVHAGVLQGPLAKARVHSRGSCTRLQTRLAPQMCPRSPQLGPVPRAAAQPGEAVRSPGAGASGLSGFTQSPPLRGTAQGRSWPAPWPLTSLPLPRSGCIPHTSSGPREGLGGGGRAAP